MARHISRGLPRKPLRWLALLLVLFTSMPPGPRPAAAQADLPPGPAVIAQANGDPVRLRATPGATGILVDEYREGSVVTIEAGPVTAVDGSLWYPVSVDGASGYMIADYLFPLDTPAEDAANPETTATAGGAPVPDAGAAPEPAPTVAAEQGFTQADVTGTATIVNTNGDPIRCRAEASTSSAIMANFREGDAVQLTGAPSGSWQPVLCGGGSGWVYTDYLSPTGSAVGGELTGSTALVSGTNGDGVRCRTSPSTAGAVITVLPEGASVGLRGGATGDWQPVTCAGQNGFVSATYLTSSDDTGQASTPVPGTSSAYGIIANAAGQGVNCRTKASLSSSVIAVLTEGTRIALRGTQSGSWISVTCNRTRGWVYGDYVKNDDGTGSDGDADSGGDDSAPNTTLVSGDVAKVSGTNGTGVRFRSKATFSASVISVLTEGTRVTVRAGSTGDWVAITANGSDGFVHMDYLAKSTSDDDDDTTSGSDNGGSSGGLATGDHAKVTDTINFRSGASFGGGVIGIALPGTVIAITGPASNGFYPVDWGGTSGYMHGDYLAWTSDPLSDGDGDASGGTTDGGAGSATGQAMVDYAMGYLGYPYVWATHGPDSFDCSGFTNWVVQHVMDMNITYNNVTQYAFGREVPRDQLQPGDLVFFQNTYTWGNSHVGIYIGDGKFIHAENEDTGVRISSLDSTYYKPRWYGARRLT